MTSVTRREFTLGGLTAMVALLTAGCSTNQMGGVLDAAGDSIRKFGEENAIQAIVTATLAAVRTSDYFAIAYENTLIATDVKNETAEDAIRRQKAAKGSGIVEELEAANNLVIALSDESLSEEIRTTAQDPDFQKSWAQVAPYFQRAAETFVISEGLQGYSFGKASIAAGKQFIELRDELEASGDLGSKLQTLGMTAEFLTRAAELLPTMTSNFKKLRALDEALQEIPDYADQREVMLEASKTLSAEEREQISAVTLEEYAEADGAVFEDPFSDTSLTTSGS